MSTSHELRRGLDGRLELGERPALIVIDFVKAYLMESSPLYAHVEEAWSACRRLLASARRAGIPVLHTTVRYQADGRDGGIYFRKVPALKLFLQGADAQFTEFAEGLEPLPGEIVVVKQYSSAFFGTSLHATLTAARIDTLLIAGLSTSGCVRATTVDACQYGFIPVVVREAVGDRPGGTHDANLFDLQVKYAEVRSLRQVQHYLSGE